MSIAIKADELSKKYTLRHKAGGHSNYVALREVITNAAKSLIAGKDRVTRTPRDEFWALKDVSFQINHGEAVGIIGRNGAGKSTLLKILSRIVRPTGGHLEITGQLVSLLEVGTGFHPELTGRENIFLNGAILGMSRLQIKSKFDEIVNFAGVERFLDTPVKRYSSGMYMRLAFAVAAHLDPEILIVDEVLAVGDAAFQKKCLGKMQDISQNHGRTILFVSHNMSAISELTQNCIYLENGTVKAAGPTAEIVERYLSLDNPTARVFESKSKQIPRVDRVEITTSHPNQIQISDASLEISFTIEYGFPRKGMCFSFQLLNQYGAAAVHCWIFDQDRPICRTGNRCVLICRIPRLRLNIGRFHIRTYLSEPPGGEMFEILDIPISFEVSILEKYNLFGWKPDACVYLEDFEWNIQQSI